MAKLFPNLGVALLYALTKVLTNSNQGTRFEMSHHDLFFRKKKPKECGEGKLLF